MQRKIIPFLLSLCLGLFAVLPSAQAQSEYTKFTHSFFHTFDTFISIIGYSKDKETFDRVAKEAEGLFQTYHRLYDPYNAYEGVNNLFILNRDAKNGPVKVDGALFDLIRQSLEKQKEMNNTVNIAMGSVLALWHEAREASQDAPGQGKLPPDEALRQAAQHIDPDNVVLDESEKTIRYLDPELQLNLGAVAKGYAAELVAQHMLASDVPHFIINAGGNIRAGHPPLDGRDNWGISVQDPDNLFSNDPPKVREIILAHDTSVVTSGDYQRYFTVDGKRYHHLVSPQTLYPANHMRAVTVMTRDSGLADLLSTALFLMPIAEGQAFLKNYPDVAALWIDHDLNVTCTDNILPHLYKQ